MALDDASTAEHLSPQSSRVINLSMRNIEELDFTPYMGENDEDISDCLTPEESAYFQEAVLLNCQRNQISTIKGLHLFSALKIVDLSYNSLRIPQIRFEEESVVHSSSEGSTGGSSDASMCGASSGRSWISELPPTIQALNLAHNEIAITIICRRPLTTDVPGSSPVRDCNIPRDNHLIDEVHRGWIYETFQSSLPELKIIDLSHNYIKTSMKAWDESKRRSKVLKRDESLMWGLEVVSLAHNPGINNVDEYLLGGLSCLKELHLEHNGISDVVFGIQSKLKHEGCNEAHPYQKCMMSTIGMSWCLPSLRALFLRGNPWKVLRSCDSDTPHENSSEASKAKRQKPPVLTIPGVNNSSLLEVFQADLPFLYQLDDEIDHVKKEAVEQQSQKGVTSTDVDGEDYNDDQLNLTSNENEALETIHDARQFEDSTFLDDMSPLSPFSDLSEASPKAPPVSFPQKQSRGFSDELPSNSPQEGKIEQKHHVYNNAAKETVIDKNNGNSHDEGDFDDSEIDSSSDCQSDDDDYSSDHNSDDDEECESTTSEERTPKNVSTTKKSRVLELLLKGATEEKGRDQNIMRGVHQINGKPSVAEKMSNQRQYQLESDSQGMNDCYEGTSDDINFPKNINSHQSKLRNCTLSEINSYAGGGNTINIKFNKKSSYQYPHSPKDQTILPNSESVEYLRALAFQLEEHVVASAARVTCLREETQRMNQEIILGRKALANHLQPLTALKSEVAMLSSEYQAVSDKLTKRRRELKHTIMTCDRLKEKWIIQEQIENEKEIDRAERRLRGIELLRSRGMDNIQKPHNLVSKIPISRSTRPSSQSNRAVSGDRTSLRNRSMDNIDDGIREGSVEASDIIASLLVNRRDKKLDSRMMTNLKPSSHSSLTRENSSKPIAISDRCNILSIDSSTHSKGSDGAYHHSRIQPVHDSNISDEERHHFNTCMMTMESKHQIRKSETLLPEPTKNGLTTPYRHTLNSDSNSGKLLDVSSDTSRNVCRETYVTSSRRPPLTIRGIIEQADRLEASGSTAVISAGQSPITVRGNIMEGAGNDKSAAYRGMNNNNNINNINNMTSCDNDLQDSRALLEMISRTLYNNELKESSNNIPKAVHSHGKGLLDCVHSSSKINTQL